MEGRIKLFSSALLQISQYIFFLKIESQKTNTAGVSTQASRGRITVKKSFRQSAANNPHLHWVKSVRIRSYSGLHFPTFGLNTESEYGEILRQSECRKMRTRITPNKDTFHAVSRYELLTVKAITQN